MAFVEGPTRVDEVRRICKEVHGPVFYNQTGISPRFSLAEMNELGIAVTILPGATLRATVQAVYDFARDLRERGPAAEVDFNERFKAHPLGNLHTFAGFDQVREWEEEYLPTEQLGKYADSVGHQPGSPDRIEIPRSRRRWPCRPCSRRSGPVTWSPRGRAARPCCTSTGTCCTRAGRRP
jgi:hypothetical protein